jgi:hypothetical protein
MSISPDHVSFNPPSAQALQRTIDKLEPDLLSANESHLILLHGNSGCLLLIDVASRFHLATVVSPWFFAQFVSEPEPKLW